MKTRILLLIMVLIACFQVRADFTVNGITYRKLTKTTVAVVNCNNVKTLNIPATVYDSNIGYKVTDLPRNALSNVYDLVELSLPATLQNLELINFNYMRKLERIQVDAGNTKFRSENGILYNASKTSLLHFPATMGATTYVIPSTIDTLAAYAFSCNSIIDSIKLPNTIRYIGMGAFEQCNNLKSITLPDSLQTISDRLFSSCTKLDRIIVPKTVSSIGEFAFSMCSELTKIQLPDNLITIEDYAFYSCSKLTSINLPASLSSLGASAFSYCKSLKAIDLPTSIRKISPRTFESCERLEKIEINSTNAYFTCKEGILYDKKQTEIICYPHGKQDTLFAIPRTVKRIQSTNFERNGYLIEIQIPNPVTTFEDGCFSQCTALGRIQLPTGLSHINNAMFNGCSSLTSILIPEGVERIDQYAFSYCQNLKSVELPSTLKTISKNAFSQCPNLEEINVSLKNALLKSENGILYSKNGDELQLYPVGKRNNSFYTPSTVKTIFSNCFYNNKYLQTITITDSVESIGKGAFEGCINLKSINIKGQITCIEALTFANCKMLESIEFPQTLTKIDETAFKDCMALKTINLPHSVQDLGKGVFSGCKSLQFIQLPNAIRSLPEEAFSNCSALTRIQLAPSLTSIGDRAFRYCVNLLQFSFPDSLTSIGEEAFDHCSKLSSIKLPKTISFVGIGAFYGCSSLRQITLLKDKPFLLLQDVFALVPLASCIVNVPTGSLERYLAKPAWNIFPLINDKVALQEEKIGTVRYFDETIPVTSTNAFSEIYKRIEKSDVGAYTRHRALDCFFILAEGVSDSIKERTLEYTLLHANRSDWDNLTLDSTLHYFKQLYPNNTSLSSIEKSTNRLKSINVGQRIPSFKFLSFDGLNTRTSESFIGKPTLFLYIDLDRLPKNSGKTQLEKALQKMLEFKKLPPFNEIQFAIVTGSKNNDTWADLNIDTDTKKWIYQTKNPDSMYDYFDREEAACLLLLDKNGIITSNNLKLEQDASNSLMSLDYRINLLKIQDFIYKPIENPEPFARAFFAQFLKNSISFSALLPADTLKMLDKKGLLRLHRFTPIIYDDNYKRSLKTMLEMENIFGDQTIKIKSVNYRSNEDDNIVDKIQLVFTVNNKRTFQFIIQNCIYHNGKWYIFHDYPACKEYNPNKITPLSTMPIWSAKL